VKKNAKNEQENLEREQRLIEGLRKRPELLERLLSIVGMSEADGDKLQSADEVEERLVEEIRRLGQEVMGQWAQSAEARVTEDFRQKNPQAGVRKKKP
jgi:hypothetical protein